MKKLNQEAFARSVLWGLAQVQSDIYKLHQMLVEIRSGQAQVTKEEAQEKWAEEADNLQDLFYDMLLQRAKLPPEKGSGGTIVLPSGGPN